MKIDNSISLISEIREQANKILITELEKKGIYGIVPSHGDLLLYLYKNKSATKTELAQNIRKGKSTITKLLTKLIKLAYVETKANEEDKRSDLVYLTEKGRELIPSIFEISEKYFELAYIDFTESEREMFLKLLKKYKCGIETYSE